MGKIKKILENELVGGTQSTDVYPITSTKAVYDENNVRLDTILKPATKEDVGLMSPEDKNNIESVQAGMARKLDKDSVVQESGDSEELVMSQKAVSDKLKGLSTEIIYDVSARNDGAVFESLQTLLSSSNLSTLIPTSVRHGGMSIRFVQSSDNKYVQFFCTANEFTTDVTKWKGVDKTIIAGSTSLIENNAVARLIQEKADVDFKVKFVTDGYYNVASNTLQFQSNRASKYVSPIDISEYVGFKVSLTIIGGITGSGRCSGICNSDGSVVSSYITEDGLLRKTFEKLIQNGDYLFLSCTNSAEITATIKNFEGKIVAEINSQNTRISSLESNVGIKPNDVVLSNNLLPGNYYAISNNKFVLTTGTGRYKAPIDLSEYVGFTLKITANLTGVNARSLGIGDLNGNIIKGWVGNDFPNTYERVIQEGDYLYLSKTEDVATTISAIVKDYSTGIYFEIAENSKNIRKNTDSIEILDNEIGISVDTLTIPLSFISDKYYKNTNDVFTLTTYLGKYCSKIDLSEYVGFKIRVELSNPSSSSDRLSGIGDIDGNIRLSKKEKDGGFEKIVETGDYLYVSCSITCTLTATILNYSAGMKKDIQFLENNVEKLKQYQQNPTPLKDLIITTSYQNITISEDDSLFCGFTHSLSTKISGRNAGRIRLDLSDNMNYRCGSYGIYLPWDMQWKIRLHFYYNDENKIATAFAVNNYSGDVFYMQGKTFQRVNFPQVKYLQIRIEVAKEYESADWEFYVTQKAIMNDDMPVAPICVMYDGGKWNGTVIDNGVSMSLWELHHKYNIPYGIAFNTNDAFDDMHPIVKADIESGFAELVYRNADIVNLYNSDDKTIVEGLTDKFNTLDAKCRFIALPQHKFNEKMYRCFMKFGADVVRTGSINHPIGILCSKYNDDRLFTLPSVRLGGIGLESVLKFPNIYWEHGVGIPPQDYVGNMYVDTDGTNTPILFARLYNNMKNGNVACLKPSEFIAMCRKV